MYPYTSQSVGLIQLILLSSVLSIFCLPFHFLGLFHFLVGFLFRWKIAGIP